MKGNITILIDSRASFRSFQHNNRVRNAIAEACESIGGGLIRVLALNDSPEPWENYGDKDC
ncbi:MAG: hypothetical protein ACI9SD_001176 [Pseudohongiellaceae bacterium]|jgi:hypothetical protein